VGRLAGGVAHDFNNMLGVILGHAEMAMGRLDKTDPNYQDFIEISKAATRSADITRQLLAFARKQMVAPKKLDLNQALEEMHKMLQRLIGEHLDLAWRPGEDLWAVKIDPSQLDQILVNLCVNARDAIADVGHISIETENATFDQAYCVQHPGFIPGEYVRLTVSDDGCGMDQKTQENIFEPFFTTKELGKGTGLGLATVFGAVKQNSGFINVYSELGHGTQFSIYLPRYTGKMKKVSRKEVSVETTTRGKETILLVVDEPSILEVATMMLERLGYTVLAANSPVESIQLAKSHSGGIDLLMTDVIMPEMNGRDVAKQVTSLFPGIRCLFMSGYTADVIAQQGVLDPDVHFIHKPFSMQDLGIKLKEALNQE
jgi:two-component system cell cycle sensor histidine kinase/response regulator CckA